MQDTDPQLTSHPAALRGSSKLWPKPHLVAMLGHSKRTNGAGEAAGYPHADGQVGVVTQGCAHSISVIFQPWRAQSCSADLGKNTKVTDLESLRYCSNCSSLFSIKCSGRLLRLVGFCATQLLLRLIRLIWGIT